MRQGKSKKEGARLAQSWVGAETGYLAIIVIRIA